jgi:DUF2075 family protein/predicted GIY-YIG superfamily endonuclease
MIDEANFSIEKYDFDDALNSNLGGKFYTKDLWPIIYILSDRQQKVAYVGETLDTIGRMKAHGSHDLKQKLIAVHLISSEQFNKSVALDIEANLIKYMSADKQYKLLNANLGIANHKYYQKKNYWGLFAKVWEGLQSKGLAKKSLGYIENLNLFKYSPYKSLSPEQNEGLLNILKSLADDTHENTLVQGGAGTGKSILAIFLFKLLTTSAEDLNFQEFGENETEIVSLVQTIKAKRPDLTMALVIPMSSFRKTLQNVFKQINGLSADMVVGPSEVANQQYDLVLVDEAHRLRQRVNLGAYFGSFDKASEKLGLDKMVHNELDWVLQQADRAVFFYDANQSIKPSDVAQEDFNRLIDSPATCVQKLNSQWRVRGGNDYVDFIDRLLNGRLDSGTKQFKHKEYEFKLYSSLGQMVEAIRKRNDDEGLSRMVAGFSWPWVSNPKKKSKPGWEPYDIIEDGVSLKWNKTTTDWINTNGSENEVGCIHTTQGYDLNYTGIIFGNEISYDPVNKEIVILKENYYDKNGKNTIKDPQRLVNYIINIYKTIMLRGIKGTYIYVCDPMLRAYMAQFIPLAETEQDKKTVVRLMSAEKVSPYKNSVPLYPMTAAAGGFSKVQTIEGAEWIPLPARFSPSEDLFACRVVGESMNKIIPNGSICLFRKYQAGSRSGKIMLVELSDFTDPDTGAAYTVKEYRSRKTVAEDGYKHQEITLLSRSNEEGYEDITLTPETANDMRVLAEFEVVLGDVLSTD